MTPTTTPAHEQVDEHTRREVRERAEAHLRALVGVREGQDDARLREDQWTAIEARRS